MLKSSFMAKKTSQHMYAYASLPTFLYKVERNEKQKTQNIHSYIISYR